jgi:hypothetical protein
MFEFYDLRWEVIVRFVDNGGFVDHHCLIIIVIIEQLHKNTDGYFQYFNKEL